MSGNGMGKDVVMPQLAESLVSATIGKWLKQPGEAIEAYEPICEVITDKVMAEIPATEAGIMREIIAQEGETVQVGAVICRMDHGSAEVAGSTPAFKAELSDLSVSEAVPAQGQEMRNRYSPAVQRLAQEHGINLNDVPGTGLGGRITRKDVIQFVENHQAIAVSVPAASVHRSNPAEQGTISSVSTQNAVSAQQPSVVHPSAAQVSQSSNGHNEPVRTTGLHLSENPRLPTIEIDNGQSGRGEYLIDVTPIRSTIARNMRQSVSEIPHAWTMIEVDVTNLVQLRNKLKNEFMRNEGINLTYLAFVLKAVVNAIKDYPIMNSVWAVDKIIVKRDINISLAVGTEDSVITPVIKKADQKNIAGLAREVEELARKTREGKLKLDDLQGGTFTINNTGSFGSISSYPIINYPQAAILTFESIVKKPVVINDMIAVRSMANMCMSLDHRILDGVICGRFLQRVKENLEGFDLETKLY
ncbi:2-oxo acid dehydrogenase subunit E2 [Paenibacillus sp. ACRRX]|uniref:dihydrolipoamide acetyltransferase family protein n=1 Tax=Paenibacillus sp. ACRRX TaxID=2918206 RepID=UPI001EF65C01|nr:dihydrolipoamide acetyltransferase family protein [Paenibacillus sp. ACRRX]MCG7406335.1 2-oxo acid dehydrogenase subunit E2 [Paenibacillus sp. ACRRX]